MRSCSYSPRESVTAAETDRSAFAESLKDKCLALDTKLQDIKRHQGEAKVQLNTQIDGLNTFQGTPSRNLDLVEHTQVKLNEQRKTTAYKKSLDNRRVNVGMAKVDLDPAALRNYWDWTSQRWRWVLHRGSLLWFFQAQ